MSAVRFLKRATLLSVTAFAVALTVLPVAPARADEAPVRKEAVAKQRTAALTLNNVPSAGAAIPVTHGSGILQGFVYATGPQSLSFRGRVNVGKTGVYVPYYGNVSADPLHPETESFAGIGYGFRGWDVSVVNGSTNGAPPAAIPGADTARANPSLSFSIRF